MKKNSRMAAVQGLIMALLVGTIFIATSQAQVGLPGFTATFTLTQQVQWDNMVLQPGHYSITIGSTGAQNTGLIRDGNGRPIAFTGGIEREATSARNALYIREKDGQLRVYSLALGTLGKVLIYDRALAQEAIMEARAPHSVPVTLAKR